MAGISDLIDGIWARKLGGSRLGVVLDPICDKVFMTAGFFVVWSSGVLGPLEILGVLLRDIVAVLAFAVVSVLRRPRTLPARAGGKAVTVCQLLTLAAAVLQSGVVRPLAWTTAAISVYAVADYIRIGWRRKPTR